MDRSIHRSKQNPNEKFVSGQIAGTSIEVWIYEDEAQFRGNGIDRRYEHQDYNSPEEVTAAFLEDIKSHFPDVTNRNGDKKA